MPLEAAKRGLLASVSVLAIGPALLLLVGSDASVDHTINRRAPESSTIGQTPGCDAPETGQLVQGFVNSFDRGDIKQLDQLFGRTGRFQWYSTDAPGQRIDPEARDRDSLIAYFEKRHEVHERLTLRSLSFNGRSASFGHFSFELVRSADDRLPPTPYVGKGAIDCDQTPGTLVVWSMARRPGPSARVSFSVVLGTFLVLAIIGGAIVWRRRHVKIEGSES